ncbi:transmembrane protein 87A [Lycorma delicatula]|uniref:transmembrane protein 87A n=1 Tax=Lycorma delicatula TaxID=130591 RepID=UPI003F517643
MGGSVNFIFLSLFCIIHSHLFFVESAFPDEGKWDFVFTENNGITVKKSLFKDSKIVVKVSCESHDDKTNITINWKVSSVVCWGNGTFETNYIRDLVKNNTVDSQTSECDCSEHNVNGCELKISKFMEVHEKTERISGPFPVPPDDDDDFNKRSTDKEQTELQKKSEQQQQQLPQEDQHEKDQGSLQYFQNIPTNFKKRPVFITQKDGSYTFMLTINSKTPGENFVAKVHIEMFGKHGYLSAADWPLLPFYGAMCLGYFVMGSAWLIVSFLQWRDLLRIQFWIGGVILLGMLEKAMFYAEYQSINTTGQPVPSAMLVAELVSCGKRTLARMLVIIVSLGFGIVKPRLGAMLHRVVGTGILYFILSAFEAYVQIMRPKDDKANPQVIANIPVAVLDSAICWWIFTSLVQTTRTLRLRRNLVKLNLYRLFTTTLIFAVFSSVVFMLYSMKFHHFSLCASNWNELWVDEAYWRLLFSVILLVIMILWRPTNNNQRYAFTPLLDAPEDDDDEEEEQFINNAYGVKMRAPVSGSNSPKQKLSTNSAEEDLKWVEENIPSSLADTALPILDSDEEIMNTRFEISKMQ